VGYGSPEDRKVSAAKHSVDGDPRCIVILSGGEDLAGDFLPEVEDLLLPTSRHGTSSNSHVWTVHIEFRRKAGPSTELGMTDLDEG